jgi:hypothetical protein
LEEVEKTMIDMVSIIKALTYVAIFAAFLGVIVKSLRK